MSRVAGESSRHFAQRRRVYLGDTAPSGRLRLDAAARFLQDVAADDAAQARLPDEHGWVVRKMTLKVDGLPALYEDVELVTWCSGTASHWAERATTLSRARGGVAIEARAVWVYVSRSTGAPIPLPPEFFARYGEASGRKVSARLVHPPPRDGAALVPWPLRASDFDVLGHVNNAAYWEPVEEAVTRQQEGLRVRQAEIEFRGGIDPGDAPHVAIARDGDALWAWFLVRDDVRASVRVECTGWDHP